MLRVRELYANLCDNTPLLYRKNKIYNLNTGSKIPERSYRRSRPVNENRIQMNVEVISFKLVLLIYLKIKTEL